MIDMHSVTAGAPVARHVVVLGIDGLRPDMIDDVTMPHLAAMRARGVSSAAHRTVFPSETRGALTALASGARPETTGVLGNDFYGRDGSGRLTGTDTIHDWRSADARLIGGMVTTPSLSEALHKQGRTFAVVTSSGQGSFTALNYRGAERGQIGFNVRHPAIAFPADLALDVARDHQIPPNGLDRGAERQTIAAFTETVWPARKPAAAILWLTEVDSASHRYGLGADAMLASMRACDEAVGQLLDWRERQPEKDDIAIFVTSDHGHSTITDFISVGDAIADAGIRAATRLTDDVDILYRRGRAPGFWLRKFDTGLLSALHDALADQPWYGACFTRAAERGTADGIVTGTLALELTGAAHHRAPDLYLNLLGDDRPNEFGIAGSSACDAGGYSGIPVGGGSHGGLHATELAAVLIGEGAGLKSGGAAIDTRTAIYDIAPTVLDLLGLDSVPGMTGRSMRELMAAGAAAEPPEVVTFTASRGGKVARIRIGRVGGIDYVDEADLVIPA